MDEYNYIPELYTLVDEEGVEQTFEMLDSLVDGDETYYAMAPYYENPEDLINDNGELVILKSDYVDGEEMLVTVDDDDEFERVGAIFLKRLEEMFDGEEDDCDCGDDGCDCCHHS